MSKEKQTSDKQQNGNDFIADVSGSYSYQDDIDNFAEIFKNLPIDLWSDVESMMCEIVSFNSKAKLGEKLSDTDRLRIKEIGDFLYNDLYSDIGKSIGKFNDIAYKGDW